jgi:hypothetical protein
MGVAMPMPEMWRNTSTTMPADLAQLLCAARLIPKFGSISLHDVTQFEQVDQGLEVASRKLGPVVSHDRMHYVPDRGQLSGRRDGYDVREVATEVREEED